MNIVCILLLILQEGNSFFISFQIINVVQNRGRLYEAFFQILLATTFLMPFNILTTTENKQRVFIKKIGDAGIFRSWISNQTFFTFF